MEAGSKNTYLEMSAAENAGSFTDVRKTCIITIHGERGMMSVDMYKIMGCCGCNAGRA